MRGSDEAQALHREYPVVDLHADTLMWSRWLDYDLHKAHEPPLFRSALGGHVDVPRMREGGMGAQFFGLVSLPVFGATRGLARVIDEQIDTLDAQIARRPGALVRIRSAEELDACRRDGRLGALLGIEGAHALEGDVDRIASFAQRGVRYLGLLHFSANDVGFPAYGRGRCDDRGMTAFGFDLVSKCEEAGVIVDLSHINKRGFMDACSIAQRPPMVSHTGVLGAYDHWRNIDDEQLRAVADLGGVIGVMFCPQYLGGDGLDPVVTHLSHIINTVGEDAAALGSDWDGFIVPTRGLADPRGLPDLTDALLKRGVSRRAIGKLLRDNVARVLRDNPLPIR
jgi:membrane dipeptidase